MNKGKTALRIKDKKILTTRELVIFAMLGTVMFVTKWLMEFLPNIHLLGMLTMTYTVVYRKKALIPLYLYVIMDGLHLGFNPMWMPYLYIWTILWAVTMLLPRNMNVKVKRIVYPAVCCLHGLLFGTLYSPAYALIMKMSLKTTLAWIINGLPYDAIHAVGNLVLGLFVLPLSILLQKLNKSSI